MGRWCGWLCGRVVWMVVDGCVGGWWCGIRSLQPPAIITLVTTNQHHFHHNQPHIPPLPTPLSPSSLQTHIISTTTNQPLQPFTKKKRYTYYHHLQIIKTNHHTPLKPPKTNTIHHCNNLHPLHHTPQTIPGSMDDVDDTRRDSSLVTHLH